jgi:hypothetical protein
MLQFLEKIQFMMSPDGAFKNYRTALSNAVTPILPYIGVSLTDLTFIEEGNQDGTNDKINFRKRELGYKSIREVTQYQISPYKFPAEDPLYTWLQELPYLGSDESLFDLSLAVEARENKK